MTLQQLHDWANSAPDHIRQIAITREGARRLLAEIEAKDETPPAFDLVAHESAPSRSNPFAAAAAVKMTRRSAL